MSTTCDPIREAATVLTRGLADLLAADGVRRYGDDAVVELSTVVGEVLRAAEAAMIEVTGEIAERSEPHLGEARLSNRRGCHDANELSRRTTRASASKVKQWTVASRAVRGSAEALSGEVLEPKLPAIREAMIDGHLGLDGVLAVAQPLSKASPRAEHEAVMAADRALAGEARGRLVLDPDAESTNGTALDADLLRIEALAWAAVLDPDGAEPVEEKAIRKRSVALGRTEDGLVRLTGWLLPDVAATLRTIHSAMNSPRVKNSVRFKNTLSTGDPVIDAFGDHPIDDRRSEQLLHDTLMTIMTLATEQANDSKHTGGSPVLVVQVREEDLATGRGWAKVEGVDDPVSLAAARRAACVGSIERVTMTGGGRITGLRTTGRVFTRKQRRAIALRDGGCVIPGCGVPAAWCEIHHVQEWARGGETHVDNGVTLCWWHHRFIDRNEWAIRIVDGIPELQAPPWFDPSQVWRPATRSHIRRVESLVRRQ